MISFQMSSHITLYQRQRHWCAILFNEGFEQNKMKKEDAFEVLNFVLKVCLGILFTVCEYNENTPKILPKPRANSETKISTHYIQPVTLCNIIVSLCKSMYSQNCRKLCSTYETAYQSVNHKLSNYLACDSKTHSFISCLSFNSVFSYKMLSNVFTYIRFHYVDKYL